MAGDGAARYVIQAPKPEPRIMRYELSDYEWTAIKPMLPNKTRGVRRVDDRRVLNGIFWVLLQLTEERHAQPFRGAALGMDGARRDREHWNDRTASARRGSSGARLAWLSVPEGNLNSEPLFVCDVVPQKGYHGPQKGYHGSLQSMCQGLCNNAENSSKPKRRTPWTVALLMHAARRAGNSLVGSQHWAQAR